MRIIIALVIALVVVVSTVYFNHALFRLGDLPFMSNTLVSPDPDPLLSLMNARFRNNPGDITVSGTRFRRDLSHILGVRRGQNVAGQDVFFHGSNEMAFGANSAEGSIISFDDAEVLIPGFRQLLTHEGFEYSRWHPEMSMYTARRIAHPFPGRFVRSEYRDQLTVTITDSQGMTQNIQNLVFTYATPLHLNADDDIAQNVRQRLSEIMYSLRSVDSVSTTAIHDLSSVLRGERREHSLSAFDMADVLTGHMTGSLERMRHRRSPVMPHPERLHTEFEVIERELESAGFTDEMIDFIMITLIITAVNDMAMTGANHRHDRFWWDYIPDLLPSGSTISTWGTFSVSFSPMAMLMIPETDRTTQARPTAATQLQLVPGKALMLYNYIMGNNNLHYMSEEFITRLLQNNTGNIMTVRHLVDNPYRRGGSWENDIRSRAFDNGDIWVISNANQGLSPGDITRIAGEIYTLQTLYNPSNHSDEAMFFYVFLHNYVLAYHLEGIDTLSMLYSRIMHPSFHVHRLLGDTVYMQGIRDMLFGTQPHLQGAQNIMRRTIAAGSGRNYDFGIAEFMAYFVANNLEHTHIHQTEINSVTQGDPTVDHRHHFFVKPFMLDGYNLSVAIQLLLWDMGDDNRIAGQNQVLLAWWGHARTGESHGETAEGPVSTNTDDFLRTVDANTPINVVGARVQAGVGFSDAFLRSFILGEGIHTYYHTDRMNIPVPIQEFEGWVVYPVISENSANILMDVFGGQNLAAFNNNIESVGKQIGKWYNHRRGMII